MFKVNAPCNASANSNEEQTRDGSQQSYNITAPTLEQSSAEKVHSLSSMHKEGDKEGKTDSSIATAFEAPDHQAPHTPYQDCRDTSDFVTATMFRGAHRFRINRSRFTNIGTVNQQSESQVFEKFKESVSFSAYHDSPVQDFGLQVHHAIHGKLLKQLQEWTDSPDAIWKITWLHGPASIGKTAIAQDIARTKQEKVVATFFFHKPDATRNDGNRLFTTLAWQLAHSIPDIKKHIVHVINERPGLPKEGVEAQFTHLLVRPFAAMMKEAMPVDRIVIIDAIDECIDIQLQRRILRVIGIAIRHRRVPLRFIISSRHDAHIQSIFDQFQTYVLFINAAIFDLAEEREALKRWEQELKQRELLVETRAHEKAEKLVQEICRKLDEREEGIRRKEGKAQRLEEEARTMVEEAKRREGAARLKEARINMVDTRSKEPARDRHNVIARQRQKVKDRKLINKKKLMQKKEEEARQREEGEETGMMKKRLEEEEESEKREEQHEWGGLESCLEERQQQAPLQEEERQKRNLLYHQFKQNQSLFLLPLLFLPFLPVHGYLRLIFTKTLGLLHRIYVPSWYNNRRP